jgi:dTDP-glucose 4,6-dehydratase
MAIDLLHDSRVFITGGTGFFGKWLLRQFAEHIENHGIRCEVKVLSRSPEAFLHACPEYAGRSWLSFVQGDILDFPFPTGRFTHVIHAATETNQAANRDSVKLFDQIVMGTRRALDFSVAASAQRFLFTSSGAVYGPQPSDMIRMPETHLGAPDTVDAGSTYGQAKRAAEQLCALYHQRHGLQATIARCFAFVGEYLPLNAHFAIGNFIHDALFSESIRVKGDGQPIRSYMHGEDLAVWLLTLLTKGRPACSYNVGSDAPITMADLATLAGMLLAPKKPIVIERARPDYAARSRYVPDISRARSELGLKVGIALEEAIMRTAKHAILR